MGRMSEMHAEMAQAEAMGHPYYGGWEGYPDARAMYETQGGATLTAEEEAEYHAWLDTVEAERIEDARREDISLEYEAERAAHEEWARLDWSRVEAEAERIVREGL